MTKKEIGQEYPLPNEDIIIASMVNELEAQVDRLYKDKKMLRQIHTKMHGCVKATFSIEPNLPENLKVGVFKDAKTFNAWVRFSNASTNPKPDKKKDVRGIAIKLMGVDGEKILNDEHLEKTQDFLLMSSETFFSKNIEQFSGLLKAFTAKSKLKVIGYLLNPLHWGLLKKVAKTNVLCSNPIAIPYWSTQPYQFGKNDRAVKYFIKPHKENNIVNESKCEPNFLRFNLAQTLYNNNIGFDFFVQFQTDADAMPIEDSTIPWDSQFFKVATLVIPAQIFDSNAQIDFGESLSFNAWHSLTEHRPLGSFNRARKRVYEALSKYRHEKNHEPMFEPKDEENFLPPVIIKSNTTIDEPIPTRGVASASVSVLVTCTKETAFNYISASSTLPDWLKSKGKIAGAKYVEIIKGPYSHVGAKRKVFLTDKSTVVEELISFNPFTNYAYNVSHFTTLFRFICKSAFGHLWFDTLDDKTRITWVYSYVARNIFGKIFLFLFAKTSFKKYMQNALANAKVQIENMDQ